ncbi:DNA repair protein rhp54 [Plakobranchus ocellatus]|uniref:DNA repair protein rhp54 n=1 Tax=Plakobranchus ocellatus TaxID=259542 RepID=A0AAV3ZBL8_9GAST|nr:DNA repair protein rhp54 [Plakobranchus ocellatus]
MSGKHGKQKKWSAESVQSVLAHIQSFPKVDSHYCRKESSREFLDQSLSISEMYRLYVERCKRDGNADIVSSDKYNRIFTENFNLSFFRPKKDRCDECVAFENIVAPNEDQKRTYAKHLKSEEKAREMKTEAKEKSKRDREFGAMCFDMQQLLPCPKSNSSTFYYKRKLYVHNLTMYDLGTAEVRCFMWPEFEARRGASEVATCLAKFIEEKSKGGCRDLSLFSDNCPGQNRNRFVAFMFCETNKRVQLDKLSLTFLQKGHTENENDSVHSVIEKSTKHAVIYSPEQWYAAVRTARKSKAPYYVEEMTHSQFVDYKTMSQQVKNFNVDDEGDKVKWSNVREFTVYGNDAQALYITYKYGGTQKRVDLQRRQRSSGGNSHATVTEMSELLYVTSQCGISKLKKEDLISLCQAGLVPVAYHSFYKSLPLCSADNEGSDED